MSLLNLSAGNSLKGYEWLRDGKVIMRFFFKDLSIFLCDDVKEEEYKEFEKYIKEKGFEILNIDYNGHTMICDIVIMER